MREEERVGSWLEVLDEEAVDGIRDVGLESWLHEARDGGADLSQRGTEGQAVLRTCCVTCTCACVCVCVCAV